MYGALDISTSALVAHRTRLNVIAANIANQKTVLNENDEYAPYRRRYVVLGQGDPAHGQTEGVHVASIEIDDSPLNRRYEPGSPFADTEGYVLYPNVNPVIETMDAMLAVRAYEANITAIEATKSMMSVALRLIA